MKPIRAGRHHPNPGGDPPPRRPDRATRPRSATKKRLLVALTVPVILSGLGATDATPSSAQIDSPLEAAVLDYRTLDGSGNNPDDAKLGQAGTIYPRVAAANYADGIGEATEGPDERYLSNRIFNDGNQNVFSENGVTHWSFVWGQFIDHTIGLREVSDEEVVIGFDPDDPLEEFTNVGLTAVHTLFLREHNRIVESLPDDLDEETKFQIARRVISGLQQYVTYNEFLPAMGVDLDPYEGYDPDVDPSITNEFATVGYRAHSQIHGEFEAEIPLAQLDDDAIDALEEQGIEAEIVGDVVEVAIPLNVAFGNPGLLTEIGLGNMLAGLSSEAAYANDEQIDNQLRSVLFQIPGPETEDPLDCLDGEALADCFSGVNDLGALDVMRSDDHGMPSYNDLREAYGLSPVTSFTDLTGEATEEFPDDPAIDAEDPIDDPDILDFTRLADVDGNELAAGSDATDAETVTVVRRTTTAARLKAIFGTVDEIDAFTGMVSEPHVEGTEFGELQLAMWESQFQALRDGDRFFYGNDPVLDDIAESYGIDYRRSLTEVIAANSEVDEADLPSNVFLPMKSWVRTTHAGRSAVRSATRARIR